MKLDPVMAEIRAYREAYAEKFGGDIEAMLDDLHKRSREDGREVVSRSPKRLTDKEKVPAATHCTPPNS